MGDQCCSKQREDDIPDLTEVGVVDPRFNRFRPKCWGYKPVVFAIVIEARKADGSHPKLGRQMDSPPPAHPHHPPRSLYLVLAELLRYFCKTKPEKLIISTSWMPKTESVILFIIFWMLRNVEISIWRIWHRYSPGRDLLPRKGIRCCGRKILETATVQFWWTRYIYIGCSPTNSMFSGRRSRCLPIFQISGSAEYSKEDDVWYTLNYPSQCARQKSQISWTRPMQLRWWSAKQHR